MRTGAHHSVTGHPLHFTVILFVQPCLKRRFVGAQIGVGNADMLKTEFGAPLFDFLREKSEIKGL